LNNTFCVHPFFDDLQEEHRAVIERIARPLRFSDGEFLFCQGEVADSACFITSGRVDIVARVPGGANVNLAELHQGDIVGELALIENHRRSASAIACGAVETLCVDNRDLSALCAHYHPASLLLMHRLACTVAGRIRDNTENSAHSMSIEGSTRVIQTDGGENSGSAFDIRPFLPSLDFFKGFSSRDIDSFISLCQCYTAPRDVALNTISGNRCSAWLVVRGSVESCLQINGEPSRATVLGPGRLATEIDWLLDQEMPLQAVTLTSCTLLELPLAARSALLSPDAHVSFRFFQSLLRNLMKRLGSQVRDYARKEQIRLSGTMMRDPMK